MRLMLRIHLQRVATLTVGAFINLNEVENKIKEILKEGFYKTNGEGQKKTYYPKHRIEEFEVSEI